MRRDEQLEKLFENGEAACLIHEFELIPVKIYGYATYDGTNYYDLDYYYDKESALEITSTSHNLFPTYDEAKEALKSRCEETLKLIKRGMM